MKKESLKQDVAYLLAGNCGPSGNMYSSTRQFFLICYSKGKQGNPCNHVFPYLLLNDIGTECPQLAGQMTAAEDDGPARLSIDITLFPQWVKSLSLCKIM